VNYSSLPSLCKGKKDSIAALAALALNVEGIVLENSPDKKAAHYLGHGDHNRAGRSVRHSDVVTWKTPGRERPRGRGKESQDKAMASRGGKGKEIFLR